MSILVVDDDAAIRMLFRTLLEAAGHDVAEACDGQEALEIIDQVSPAVVLLDVMMPRLDGWQVLAHLRSADRFRSLPVIMVTALADPETERRASTAGATRYLSKPVASAELVAAVNDLAKATPTA